MQHTVCWQIGQSNQRPASIRRQRLFLAFSELLVRMRNPFQFLVGDMRVYLVRALVLPSPAQAPVPGGQL